MMKNMLLTAEQNAALADLEAIQTRLGDLGLCVFHATLYFMPDDSSVQCNTHISLPYPADNLLYDHAFGDAVRNLSVEWSNSRHAAQLVWKDPEPTTAAVRSTR
jgi:hypothetical protein